MSFEDPNKSLDEIVAKESWAREAVLYVTEKYSSTMGLLNYDTALKASRLASLWVDEYKAIMESAEELVDGSPLGVFRLSQERALVRAEGIDTYPTGAPTLTTIIASWYAFSYAFGPEADMVFAILTEGEKK